MGKKYKLNDGQFNEIRIAYSKVDAIGGFLAWIKTDKFWVGLGDDVYRNLGEIINGEVAKIDKVLDIIERKHLDRLKENRLSG